MDLTQSRRWWLGLGLGLAAGLGIWFGPPIEGLSPAAQKGLALMATTVLFWIFRIAHEAITGLLFVVAVIMLKVMPPRELLVDWTEPNLWFAVSAFILGAAVAQSGLIRRLTYVLLLRIPNTFAALTAAIFVIQALFTLLGVAGSFARIALLYPLVMEIAKASGLSRDARAFKGLAIAVMASGEPAMLLTLTGFWLSPFAMKLSGVELLYSDWLRLFTLPALALMVITWLTVVAVFRSKEPLAIPKEELQARLAELGPVRRSGPEMRTVLFLVGILLLWVTDSRHQIKPGWVALLGACLLLFPRIGVLELNAGMAAIRWPIVLFLGAAFGLGRMVQALGLNVWLGRPVLPDVAPDNVVWLTLLVSAVTMTLHLFTGDVASSMSVTIPAITGYASEFGFNPAIFGFIAYVCSWEQYLFPFQNAGVLMAYGYGYFNAKDLLKFGLVLTVVIPLGLVAIGLPYWQFLGALR